MNDLVGAIHGIGDNKPPLEDQLDLELQADKDAAEAVLKVVAESIITDDTTAEKVTILARKISDLKKQIEDRRDERLKPHVAIVATIRTKFNAVIGPLEAAYRNLHEMLDTYVKRRAADAAIAKAVAEAEARRLEDEARQAREAANEAQTSGDRLKALQAEEAAAAAAQRADAIRPRPIRTAVASVGQVREIQFEIQDLTKCMTWMRRACRQQLEEAVNQILSRHLRGLGVDQVARGLDIPGCRVWVGSRAQIRR